MVRDWGLTEHNSNQFYRLQRNDLNSDLLPRAIGDIMMPLIYSMRVSYFLFSFSPFCYELLTPRAQLLIQILRYALF